jgi:predicted nuclease with TOPRIM domain
LADATFIAHARTDVPALVEAVRKRDAEIARLTAELQKHYSSETGEIQKLEKENAALREKLARLVEKAFEAHQAMVGMNERTTIIEHKFAKLHILLSAADNLEKAIDDAKE